MRPRLLICLSIVLLSLIAVPLAQAAGGNYAFDGGTAAQQAQVRAALETSRFDWGLVTATVTIHIGRGAEAEATPGHVQLPGALLDMGRFSWGIVQHEYAHQVDFFLLDAAKRAQLQSLLGGKDWCGAVPGLAHDEYGCERFASTLAWSYWHSRENTMEPSHINGESGGMAPKAFRSALATLLSMPADPAGETTAVVRATAPSAAMKAKAKAKALAKAKKLKLTA